MCCPVSYNAVVMCFFLEMTMSLIKPKMGRIHEFKKKLPTTQQHEQNDDKSKQITKKIKLTAQTSTNK